MRASAVIDKAARERVERAIREAETKTAAEIVVALASRSGRYDRAEDIVGLILGLLVTGVVGVIFRRPPEPGSFDMGVYPDLHIGVLLIVFLLTTAGGAGLATAMPRLARPFIRRREREEEVRKAGMIAFHHCRTTDTTTRGGLLIYASLYERTIWVVADDRVRDALGPDGEARIRDAALNGFDVGDTAKGLAAATTAAGTMLADALPRQPDDENELPDRLWILD